MPLSDQGERNAQGLSTLLHTISFAKALSSPLQRAWRTGELAGYGDCMLTDPDLTEWDYGAYESRRTVDIQAERPGWRLFEDGCPGGETLEEVSLRADRVISRIRASESPMLVFAHRDILRTLIARWVALPALAAQRFDLATASVSILGYDHGLDKPLILQLNDARH